MIRADFGSQDSWTAPHSEENESAEHANRWAEMHEHIRDELLGTRGNKQTGVGGHRRLARRAVWAVPGVRLSSHSLYSREAWPGRPTLGCIWKL